MFGDFYAWVVRQLPILFAIGIFLTIPVTRFVCHHLFDNVRGERRVRPVVRAIRGSFLFFPLLIVVCIPLLGIASPLLMIGGTHPLVVFIVSLAASLMVICMGIPLIQYHLESKGRSFRKLCFEEVVLSVATIGHLIMGFFLQGEFVG